MPLKNDEFEPLISLLLMVQCCSSVAAENSVYRCRFLVYKVTVSLPTSCSLLSVINLNVSHSAWPRHMG